MLIDYLDVLYHDEINFYACVLICVFIAAQDALHDPIHIGIYIYITFIMCYQLSACSPLTSYPIARITVTLVLCVIDLAPDVGHV